MDENKNVCGKLVGIEVRSITTKFGEKNNYVYKVLKGKGFDLLSSFNNYTAFFNKDVSVIYSEVVKGDKTYKNVVSMVVSEENNIIKKDTENLIKGQTMLGQSDVSVEEDDVMKKIKALGTPVSVHDFVETILENTSASQDRAKFLWNVYNERYV